MIVDIDRDTDDSVVKSTGSLNVIVGKVVAAADGDTITVLEKRGPYRIRLFGIDAPERHQDFSNRAKQFASDLVFGKQVRVVKKDIDRYDRIVGIVYVGDVCVNEEIVRNGLAWVYRYYCKIPICTAWLDLEAQARDSKMGLWSHPDPVPPWEFRRVRRLNRRSRTSSSKVNGDQIEPLKNLSGNLRSSR